MVVEEEDFYGPFAHGETFHYRGLVSVSWCVLGQRQFAHDGMNIVGDGMPCLHDLLLRHDLDCSLDLGNTLLALSFEKG